MALQAAAERQVPRRHAVHRRRRGLLDQARAAAELRHQGLRQCDGRAEEDRQPHGRVQPERREPDLSAARQLDLHHEQGVGREEQGREDPRLQRRRAEFRCDQRQRHRPVHAGVAPARRQDRLQALRRLVGQARGQCAGCDLHADQEPLDPRRRADLGRARHGARPASDRHPAPAQHARREGDRWPREPHHLHRHGPGPRRAALQQRQGQEPVQGPARAAGAVPGRRRGKASRPS